jgi:hypothetical protein
MTDHFSGWSFMTGMISGMIIRYTDVVPIIGGIILGFSINRLPEVLNFNDLPNKVRLYVKRFNDTVASTEILETNKEVVETTETKKLDLKKK